MMRPTMLGECRAGCSEYCRYCKLMVWRCRFIWGRLMGSLAPIAHFLMKGESPFAGSHGRCICRTRCAPFSDCSRRVSQMYTCRIVSFRHISLLDMRGDLEFL